MEKNQKPLKCVAFPYDLDYCHSGDDILPPRPEQLSRALNAVFGGACPTIVHYQSGSFGYYVVCSHAPTAAEAVKIKERIAALVDSEPFEI